ncbi:hypothetical protein EDC01DRAFT_782619 [Geopyxis carbonaria]|nr:hypothetical protein EDC01DRAFT_782619 [Geopyxis carbonaria]
MSLIVIAHTNTEPQPTRSKDSAETHPHAANTPRNVSAQAAQHQQQNTFGKPDQLNSSISQDADCVSPLLQGRAIMLFFDDHGLTPKGDFIDAISSPGATYIGRAEDRNMLVTADEGNGEVEVE